jgi:hypothetical protein
MRKALRTPLACLILGAVAEGNVALSAQMYCPRGNLLLRTTSETETNPGERSFLTISSDWPENFPASGKDIKVGGDISTASIEMADCSDRKFLCKSARIVDRHDEVQQFYLVVPRVVEVGREYTYRGVKLITRAAIYPRSEHLLAVKITLWQKIGGVEAPMELTVQDGRGVTYWDGVKFDLRQTGNGELCVTTSDTGLFGSLTVRGR